MTVEYEICDECGSEDGKYVSLSFLETAHEDHGSGRLRLVRRCNACDHRFVVRMAIQVPYDVMEEGCKKRFNEMEIV